MVACRAGSGRGAAGLSTSQSTATDECRVPRAAWVFYDDFEADRLARYFEAGTANGAFVRAPGMGVDGSWGMRARFDSGTVSAGALHLALGRTPQRAMRPADGGDQRHRELYWQVFLRH